MLDLDCTILAAVVEKATHDAAQHPRWLVAIGRAILELETNPYLERDDHGGLIIGSPSGKCYTSNGVCQCKAYEFRIACWHRAAARLVRLHDERQAAAAIPAPDTWSDRYDAWHTKREAARTATALLNECYS